MDMIIFIGNQILLIYGWVAQLIKYLVLIKGLTIILFQQALYLLMKLNCSLFTPQIYLKVESIMNLSLFTFL